MNRKQVKSNNFIRKVLQEIIQEPLPPNKRHDSQHKIDRNTLKTNEAFSYLENKIQMYQAEIQVLSQELSKEINLKEHICYLYNKEKEKAAKMYDIIEGQSIGVCSQVDRNSKAPLESRQRKKSHDLLLLKNRQKQAFQEQLILPEHKKEQKKQRLQRLMADKKKSTQKSLESQVVMLRQQLTKMKQTQQQSLQSIISLKEMISQQEDQLKKKSQTILFSQEHLRRVKMEYQELQSENYQEKQQFYKIILEMKKLLHRQNLKIDQLENKGIQPFKSKNMPLDITLNFPIEPIQSMGSSSNLSEESPKFCSKKQQNLMKFYRILSKDEINES